MAETEKAGRHDLLLLLQLVDQRAVKFNSTSDKLTPGSGATLLESLLDGDFLSPADLIAERYVSARAALKLERESAKPEVKWKYEDSIRPFGLTTFALGAGLLKGYGSLTELGHAYLAGQEPEQLLEAFETWTKEGPFDEITRIDAIRGLRSRASISPSPVCAASTLWRRSLGVLRMCRSISRTSIAH